MSKYKFEQFNVEIENPTIDIDMTNVTDDTVNRSLTVVITMTTDTAKVYGIVIDGLLYTTTWTDSDVPILLNRRLKDFEVK